MTIQQMRDFLTRVPFNTLLGMRLHRIQRDGITIACTLRPGLQNSAGAAHSGVTAAMADAAVASPFSATSTANAGAPPSN